VAGAAGMLTLLTRVCLCMPLWPPQRMLRLRSKPGSGLRPCLRCQALRLQRRMMEALGTGMQTHQRHCLQLHQKPPQGGAAGQTAPLMLQPELTAWTLPNALLLRWQSRAPVLLSLQSKPAWVAGLVLPHTLTSHLLL
jgi:hypothetical protein